MTNRKKKPYNNLFNHQKPPSPPKKTPKINITKGLDTSNSTLILATILFGLICFGIIYLWRKKDFDKYYNRLSK